MPSIVSRKREIMKTKNDVHETRIPTGGLATTEAEVPITVATNHHVAPFSSADGYSTIWT